MLDWTSIDTVLLDMDGTLLDLAFDNFFWLEYLPEQYAAHHNLPLEESRARLQARSEALYGSLDWYCLDYWSRDLDMDIEALKRKVAHRIRFRPHTHDFLTWLRARGKETVLVTNAHPGALELKATSAGLHELLARRISSHEFGLAKENAGFWHKLSEREGLTLARCLFIDDSPPVLQRARREGLGQVLQVLQPDSRHPPRPPGDFAGIVDFTELMSEGPHD